MGPTLGHFRPFLFKLSQSVWQNLEQILQPSRRAVRTAVGVTGCQGQLVMDSKQAFAGIPVYRRLQEWRPNCGSVGDSANINPSKFPRLSGQVG